MNQAEQTFGTVTVDRQFFVKERNNYSNWALAFWRELFQNSVDAGSRNIDVQFEDHDDGNVTVAFKDDGRGMSREVLERVFFRLGATTKDSGASIGGFGKARILICWSQPNYSIRSHDYLVSGDGAAYSILKTDTTAVGCEFKITVDTSNRFNNKVNLRQSLRDYLGMSHMAVRITSNDSTIDGWKNWMYKRRLTRELSFGKVYVNKSKRSNQMYIRTHGALMFSKWIDPTVQIVVEINPDRSRDVLLSNRDSLHSEFEQELDRFIQEVAIDKRTAFRDRTREETIMFSTSKLRTERRRAAANELPSIVTGVAPSEPVTVDEVALDAQADRRQAMEAARNAGIGSTVSVLEFASDVHTDVATDVDEVVQAMVIEIETSNSDVKKVIARYNPSNWVPGERKGKAFMAGTTYKKLLKMWHVACDWAIAEYLDITGQDGLDWRPGFIFSDSAEAAHKSMSDDSDALLLNPVNDKGTLRYRLRSDADRSILMALAAHEVTHCLHSMHDESYAGLFTDIIGRLIRHKRAILKEMNDVIKM